MLAPLKWLKEYVDINIPTEEYARRMIMAGNGVEGTSTTGSQFSKVVVGYVVSCVMHPNSDHLHICMVDVGESEPIQIVCGAPNVHAGMRVAAALDGAELPGGKIKKGKLRGEVSNGMLCSGPELDVPNSLYPNIGDEGIIEIFEDVKTGTDVKEVFGLGDDVMDFEVLANRPDCLSIWGMARETAAVLGTQYKAPKLEVKEADVAPMSDSVSIEVQDSDLCPRYIGKLIRNVRIGQSPKWLRDYLYAAGMRPINNIVDITNFVMIETGNPMHAFDMSKVRDGKIIVRRAQPGEILKTLDGKDRELDESMLVIADGQQATGLAGIMGGEESEITEGTHDVLFECAAFDRTCIRLTSRKLGMRTDASGHYERGVCPAMTMDAMKRACELVNMLDAGDVAPGIVDIYPNPEPEKVITASIKRIQQHIGIEVPAEKMVEILDGLDMHTERDGDNLVCHVPRYRMDMESYADVSEEVLRLYGYDNITSTLMTGVTTRGGKNHAHIVVDRAREALLAEGAYEIETYSFVSPHDIEKLGLAADDARLNPVRLLNPLGEDTSVMRTTLTPSMLQTLSYNLNHGNPSALMFETAMRFEKTSEMAQTPDGKLANLPNELNTLEIGMYGDDADFYRLKAIVDSLLTHFNETGKYAPDGDGYFHPGRKARVSVNGKSLGQLGEIHPDVAAAFDMAGKRVYIAEIDLGTLDECEPPIEAPKPIPKFPAVSRDLALVMDESQPVGDIIDEIKHAAGKICEDVAVFDVYRGIQLGMGKKSVAFSLTLRAADHTLVDDEINSAMKKVMGNCKHKFGAELR